MEQQSLGKIPEQTRLESFSKDELIQRCTVVEDELRRLVRENYQLRNQQLTDTQLRFVLESQIQGLQETVFGEKSERYKKPGSSNNDGPKPPPKPRIQKPSERYPNLPVVEKRITLDPPPTCQCCGNKMSDSGMTEDSEQLNVIPKRYEIVLQKRSKYSCSQCHGDLKTAPLPARIKEGSVLTDDMVIDVALSKYCDLIPIERYTAMAARSGLMGLPPHSLIESTHHLADFVEGVYLRLKDQAFKARVLRGDETPHRMLEGSDTKHWYLWGFSTTEVGYFECHDTRAGSVASDLLMNSLCEILVTDAYTGYGKAIRLANEKRSKENRPLIRNANCNAHSRRYFFKAWKAKVPEAQFYLDHYHEIYQLEAKARGRPPNEILELRGQMKIYFEEMRSKAMEDFVRFPKYHKLAKAIKYFLNNFEDLVRFLTDPDIPIDNNLQESLFRSYVVGRKTWLGTHSERGARTAAILFSIVETCKLNKVNPREYFKKLVEDLHQGKSPYTPKEFADLSK